MQVERLIPIAKELLIIPLDESTSDLWLWEHTHRVMRLAELLAGLVQADTGGPDMTALAAAALFHDAGWTVEYRQGRWKPWQILSRPTTDVQRELGAALLQEHAGALLPAVTVRLAAEAIRQIGNRATRLMEARLISDAESLDEVGTLYVLRQFRQYQAEGRPLEQLVNSWQRQKEYRYWDFRLRDGFRFDVTRALARQRLEAVDAFMSALGRDLHGADVRELEPGTTGTAKVPST